MFIYVFYNNYMVNQDDNLWLITYKKLRNGMYYESDYDICIRALRKYGDIIYDHYEVDSKDKLHYHAVWRSSRSNPYFKLLKFEGYNLNAKTIWNIEGAHKYINKIEGQRENQQAEAQKYFHTTYAFS